MNAQASQRLPAMRNGVLVAEAFPIAKRSPGELPPLEDRLQVGAMRQVTRNCLLARGLFCIADDAALVVSELVTNAIVHSGGQRVTVALSLRDGFLRIDVHDGVPNSHALPRAPCDADEHGRGLVLVKAIAEEQRGTWGIEDGGATTWCELSLTAS